MLRSLSDPAAILYRQRVLADCIAEPDIIREMYAITVGALQDKRGLWGYSSAYPASILSGAVRQLEVFIVRLRELRRSLTATPAGSGPQASRPCSVHCSESWTTSISRRSAATSSSCTSAAAS